MYIYTYKFIHIHSEVRCHKKPSELHPVSKTRFTHGIGMFIYVYSHTYIHYIHMYTYTYTY